MYISFVHSNVCTDSYERERSGAQTQHHYRETHLVIA